MNNNKENYYKTTKNADAHLNVKKFLSLDVSPKKAIDIGCGAGRDTIALLENNWEVIAVDKENTESMIKEKLTDAELKKFKFVNSVFGKMDLPKSDLVVANYSLPFSKKEYFNSTWNKINDSISEDGYFVGNFLGEKDSWKQDKEDIVFLSEEEVKSLFKDFELIQFNEIEKDVKITSGKEKHWHIYDVIAKKKTKK